MCEEQISDSGTPDPSSADRGRREALRKIALYGAVTAPVLLGMLTSEKALAQTIPPD